MTIGFVSIIRDSWGGSEELWAASAEEALKSGNRILISAYETKILSPKTKALIKQGAILVSRIGTIEKNISKINYLKKRVRRIYHKTIGNPFNKLFSYKPDIILYIGTGSSIAEDYKLVQLIKKKKAKFFINVQLSTDTLKVNHKNKVKIKEAYKSAARVLFVSKKNKRSAEELFNSILPNALVVRNPVNMQDKSIIPYPTDKTIQMAMVGNLITVHKGQDIVLNILKEPTWQQRDWHLNIYGSGPDEDLLKELCETNSLTTKVTFHGKVNDIRAVWQKNHLLLMPSLMEGMPLAVVEAMLCGRPCIVTDVGGMVEWVEEEKSGFVADTPSVASFTMAMEKAWQFKEKWLDLGINAHNRAMELYDPHPGKTLLDLLTGKQA